MPDEITDEERALIDAAMAAGKVTRIEKGASAFDFSQKMTPEEARRIFNPWVGRPKDRKVEQRRKRVAALARNGQTADQIAQELQISRNIVYSDAKLEGASLPPAPRTAPEPRAKNELPRAPRPPKMKDPESKSAIRSRAIAKRRESIVRMFGEGKRPKEMAGALGCSEATVFADMAILGLKREKKAEPIDDGLDKVNSKRARSARRKVDKIADRRRVKITAVPGAGKPKTCSSDAAGTIFRDKVEAPGTKAPLLKDGRNNSKIGGDVLKGRLKGARLYTLTLEERATCPRSCDLWTTCYGNAMPHSTRWKHGPELESQLRDEVAALCADGRLILLRLHVLGDFYSTGYVRMWADLLFRHPNLTVFGFTAWPARSPIGGAIDLLRETYPLRFMVRRSGATGRWGSFVIDFPTEKRRLGDAIVCPEQAEAMDGKQGRHCGNCALCWHTDAPIVFVEH